MSATVTIENDIALIKMDDGKANAINPTMLEALHACLDEAERDAKVVVITGREGRFSGGFDLKVLGGGNPEEAMGLVKDGGKLAMRLYGFKLPVVGACTGHGVAMGSFILLSCDVRIGAKGDFKLGANETAIGMVVPLFAAELIKARIDPRRLTEACVTGQLHNPDVAAELGFLDQVVEPDKVLDTAMAVAHQLVPVSGTPYAGNKLMMRQHTIDLVAPSLV